MNYVNEHERERSSQRDTVDQLHSSHIHLQAWQLGILGGNYKIRPKKYLLTVPCLQFYFISKKNTGLLEIVKSNSQSPGFLLVTRFKRVHFVYSSQHCAVELGKVQIYCLIPKPQMHIEFTPCSLTCLQSMHAL